MAAVTYTGTPINDIGKTRRVLYNAVTGGNGSTLATGLNVIYQVNVQLTTTNPPTNIAISGGTITFSAGGTFTTNVEVVGQ